MLQLNTTIRDYRISIQMIGNLNLIINKWSSAPT
jgi:hypothetical protein